MRRDKPTIDMPDDARVHLGHGRRLEPHLEAAESGSAGYAAARATTDYVGAGEVTLRSDQPGMLPRQRLKYRLTADDEQVFLQGRGLLNSYGIFGAPGSGKTFLFKYLLRQVLGFRAANPDLKYGALILDPKAALIDDLTAIVNLPEVGRAKDLVVVNAETLNANRQAVNVIDCAVDTWALADMLVLAARSAGITASEDYWFLEWANLFGASLFLLDHFTLDGVSNSSDIVTLRVLLDALLLVEPGDWSPDGDRGRAGLRGIQRLAIEAESQLGGVPDDVRADARLAISQIHRFFKADYVHTIMAFVSRAYGSFQRSTYECYSPPQRTKLARKSSFYDEIIEDGKIVLVSVSPADPLVAKTLCTLVKSLFQQTVIQRLDRHYREADNGRSYNFRRPVLLGCDEYAEIASEVPGQPMGDGRFFSLSREFGCMGLLATQSVNVMQATSLKENWKSVFSTFGAKIFMRLADNETAKEASELAGKSTWYVTSRSVSHGKEGLSGGEQRSIQQFETLPTEVTTQGFEMGDAVVVGSLSGGGATNMLHFFRVPGPSEQEDMATKMSRAASPVAAGDRTDAPPPPAVPVPKRRATFDDD
jgi:hypothetical protein